MLSIPLIEITQLVEQLADYPEALRSLQEIEDCDGDLNDAALSLALRAGLEPTENDGWLEGFAKRYRHIACLPEFRANLTKQQIIGLIQHLTHNSQCPNLLAVPVVLYISKTGVDHFCQSFDNSRV
ncbi:hypothetical protein D0962_10460 [Leptolyngbyaceae cyanobacterium CCMR0082]|uniref:Uncharacterized protein n=1 Tax=Adonisia turfae CCMR0082 TaxID=2304604 RepID=A0A6M0S4F1_9CYAN|nr:hypothetical protein [Adonisia turfae]MDV3351529.1 hypothetical protein [Leptothoe sp. LEGE 181152]NEZ63200.1 hypothetical protein [Adonisia turfae CCMR0082]